ncbi:heme o synthase [Fibrella arboris]|uniref:heme o synthase n=1 Tax=Fibrella arboris TaxID=3242486 RepID=UPI0035215FA4
MNSSIEQPTVPSTNKPSRVNWRDYLALTKLRLSTLVGFSAVLGYLLAATAPLSVIQILLFAVSGLLITGAANAVNQVLEVEFDRLMKRTDSRPLPTGRISKERAIAFVAVLLFIGLFIQTLYFNPLTAGISFISFLLYGFVYTPLKRVGSIAVYVGAIPGGLPPLIGWVAFTGTIENEAIWLFAIQFIWQFTHFWAVAWVLDEDYAKAGFKLLPLRRPAGAQTALVILSFTMWLIPLGVMPYYWGYIGVIATCISVFAAFILLWLNVGLVRKPDIANAKRLMFAAFAYLPIVQIAFVLDRV